MSEFQKSSNLNFEQNGDNSNEAEYNPWSIFEEDANQEQQDSAQPEDAQEQQDYIQENGEKLVTRIDVKEDESKIGQKFEPYEAYAFSSENYAELVDKYIPEPDFEQLDNFLESADLSYFKSNENIIKNSTEQNFNINGYEGSALVYKQGIKDELGPQSAISKKEFLTPPNIEKSLQNTGENIGKRAQTLQYLLLKSTPTAGLIRLVGGPDAYSITHIETNNEGKEIATPGIAFFKENEPITDDPDTNRMLAQLIGVTEPHQGMSERELIMLDTAIRAAVQAHETGHTDRVIRACSELNKDVDGNINWQDADNAQYNISTERATQESAIGNFPREDVYYNIFDEYLTDEERISIEKCYGFKGDKFNPSTAEMLDQYNYRLNDDETIADNFMNAAINKAFRDLYFAKTREGSKNPENSQEYGKPVFGEAIPLGSTNRELNPNQNSEDNLNIKLIGLGIVQGNGVSVRKFENSNVKGLNKNGEVEYFDESLRDWDKEQEQIKNSDEIFNGRVEFNAQDGKFTLIDPQTGSTMTFEGTYHRMVNTEGRNDIICNIDSENAYHLRMKPIPNAEKVKKTPLTPEEATKALELPENSVVVLIPHNDAQNYHRIAFEGGINTENFYLDDTNRAFTEALKEATFQKSGNFIQICVTEGGRIKTTYDVFPGNHDDFKRIKEEAVE